MNLNCLQAKITQYFGEKSKISENSYDLCEAQAAVEQSIQLLNTGQVRVAEPNEAGWQVNTWLKQAILLYFQLQQMQLFTADSCNYYDKIPLKYQNYSAEQFAAEGVRVVPPATVRFGAYIAARCILMPCYVNIGAHVGSGSLIDTWATIGSCAQIGENVHISGGAGIGGVLEPLQANPTIIEDNCFIGARSEIVEGVIVEKNSVISMGVYIGQSTKIYHRQTGEIFYGRVPEGSVVVPGNLPTKDGSHSLYAAIIVKQVDTKTRAKVSINELLRC